MPEFQWPLIGNWHTMYSTLYYIHTLFRFDFQFQYLDYGRELSTKQISSAINIC